MRSLLGLVLAALLLGPPISFAEPPTVTADAAPEPSLASLAAELKGRFGAGGEFLLVDVSEQALTLVRDGMRLQRWPVSTATSGIGNRENSQRTPLGVHRVAQKIGADAPLGTLFKARRDTGRTVEILTDDRPAAGDYVTTRILWLEGLEPGVNRGPGIDSFKRYIYIHGTAEEGRIGRPASHGCVRMRNADVVELFDRVAVGTLVVIRE